MKFRFRSLLVAAILAVTSSGLAFGQGATDPQADDQYNFATQLFGQKLYELAIQQYEKFVADYPKHPNVHRARIRIGESYLRSNQHARAVQAFERVLGDRPDNNFRLECLVGLGLAQHNLQQYEKAGTALSEALQLAGDLNEKNLGPISAYWLGESRFQAKRYREAATAYQAVSRWQGNPLAVTALYSIGFCQQADGQEGQAIETWLRVAADFPNAPEAAEATFRAAEGLIARKEFPRAERAYRDLLARYGTSEFAAQSQLGLGWIAFQQKDYATARTAFDAVESRHPKSEQAKEARLRAADCAYHMKDYAGASTRYEAVARGDDPKLAREAKYWLSVCRTHQGDTRSAMSLLSGLSQDPGDPALAQRARLRLAELQLAAGENDAAAATYRSAGAHAGALQGGGGGGAGNDPAGLDQATYGLGLALYRQRKTAEAETQFAAIVRRGARTPSAPLAAVALGQCQVDGGRHNDAVQTLTAALRAELPAEAKAPALFLLGQAQVGARQSEAAIGSFRQVVDQHGTSQQAAPAAAELLRLYREAKRNREVAETARLLVERYSRSPAAAEALLSYADEQREASELAGAADLYRKVLGAAPLKTAVSAAHAGLALCYAGERTPDVERANRELDLIAEGEAPAGYQARIRYLVGRAYEKAGRHADAGGQYQAVLRGSPTEELAAMAGLRSGITLLAQKRTDEAAAALRQVADRYPRSKQAPEALYELAWAFTDGGRKAEALPLFARLERAWGEDPLGIDASFRLAEEDFAGKRFPGAAERYERVANSSHPGELADKAWYKLGWCRREMKDMVASGRAFAALVSRHEKSLLAHEGKVRLAEALIGQGQGREAARLLQEAITGKKPATEEERWLIAQARVALAGIQLQEGDGRAAFQTAQPAAATAFGTVGMQAQLLCAEALAAQGQHAGALAEFLKMVTIYPRVDEHSARAHFRIGETAEKLGQRELAAKHWNELLKSYPESEWAKQARTRLGS